VKLYSSLASPFARKVRVCARELGLAARLEEINTAVLPQQPNRELMKVNPLIKLPALVADDGLVLFDSPVICEYLDALAGGGRLFPSGGAARWSALRLQALADGILDAAILCRYETVMRPQELRWSDWIDGQKTKWHEGLDFLEREAASLHGDPTIGSITAACALGWLDFRWGEDDWRQGRPGLAAWYERFAARASMQDTLPRA
jgi:glutathione S-transferase